MYSNIQLKLSFKIQQGSHGREVECPKFSSLSALLEQSNVFLIIYSPEKLYDLYHMHVSRFNGFRHDFNSFIWCRIKNCYRRGLFRFIIILFVEYAESLWEGDVLKSATSASISISHRKIFHRNIWKKSSILLLLIILNNINNINFDYSRLRKYFKNFKAKNKNFYESSYD